MSELELAIIQKLLLVAIEIAVPPLLAFLVVVIKRYLARLRKYHEWVEVEQAVRRAVTAAEQRGLTDDLREYGDDKLSAAIAFVEAQLAAKGLPLDVDEHVDAIRALIEAEVRHQFPNA